ncbi:MAG: hypothetical protein ACAH80_08730 [Alphaproteobacteria bacterium]
MKQYKITYPFTLKPSSGGFCTTPFEIVQQMDNAQRSAMKSLRAFIAAEKLQDSVKSIVSMKGEIGIALLCTDEVADKLRSQPFVSSVEEMNVPPPSPKFKL